MPTALFGLQLFVTLFLALHDWVPLPPLNNVPAAQAADPRGKLVAVTALSTAPFALGLAASGAYLARPYPGWLQAALAIAYLGLLAGQIRAWWVPYFIPEPARAARYAALFAGTHGFLPARNGIRPNTLHLMLTAAILVVLALLVAMALTGSGG